ncbi:hypothetical protein ACODM8_18625 [Vibrio ostreicida]|uniref:Uncharacterized protein n=1 Tax=Vibrio ostreicida TaxID=526588 RepID=A0ABT8BWM1_9VIBR|nr:hypothetical protein [Vibrio ostreicida]MDN3611416.1 hypothetical protein [Vibrio ostreicida]NPD08925.1 hypothetical protein [Vibrio ostreicida]
MKMTTTLLAALLLASTGAIANTTALTDQENQIIEKAAILDMRGCAVASLEELRNPERRAALNGLFQSMNMELQSIGYESAGSELPSSEQMASAILAMCKAKY